MYVKEKILLFSIVFIFGICESLSWKSRANSIFNSLFDFNSESGATNGLDDRNNDINNVKTNYQSERRWNGRRCLEENGLERINCHLGKFATKEKCESKGCCWSPLNGSPSCFYSRVECVESDIQKIDCFEKSEQACLNRGCCWKPVKKGLYKVPWCYYRRGTARSEYTMSSPLPTDFGYTLDLALQKLSHWPKNVNRLKFDVMFETPDRLHFKIFDAQNQRYEVPLNLPKFTQKASNTNYDVIFVHENFGMLVKDKAGNTLFDCSVSPLTFSNQFIEISTFLPTPYIYGLGERRGKLRIDSAAPQKITIWTHDSPPQERTNLYGAHPFFLGHSTTFSYGVFLLNSNAMDVIIENNILKYRTIGGILDFYIFTGASPDDIIRQYTNLIGYPFMPPYWGLGFHLCRWGYTDTAYMKRIIKRMREGRFPYDTQWNDIDYMDNYRDFSINSTTYGDLPAVVDDLHSHGQRYIILLDPVINKRPNYDPYQKGLDMDVFIKDTDNKTVYLGQVYPGITAFLDFSHPNATDYWHHFIKFLHDEVKFDGIWIDMNGPSNFLKGKSGGCPKESVLDNPPYKPAELYGDALETTSICSSANQYMSTHYNLHSLFAFMEGIATHKALTKIIKKRFMLISQCNFAGIGHYAAHWSGDNSARWEDLRYSVAEILNFNMFGVPMISADICGFALDTNEELCTRWMQLGAFYPFMRNQNQIGHPDQDPGAFPPITQDRMRKALSLRYSLLPYLYTAYYTSHKTGTGIVRPIFFQYPFDINTFDIETQFMFGPALMVTPVLTKGAVSVQAYIPDDKWYDWFGGQRLPNTRQQPFVARLDTIVVHIRGGTIVTTQEPDVTTVKSRMLPFNVTVAMPAQDHSFSDFLYWDDGESFFDNNTKIGNILQYNVYKTPWDSVNSDDDPFRWCFISQPSELHYKTTMTLNYVRILGVPSPPTSVRINKEAVSYFNYDYLTEVLIVKVGKSMLETITVDWGSIDG